MRPIKEKKERSLNTKLFLKAERCNSPKCVMIRRPYKPGQHGKKRSRPISEFGKQLQEKQKIQTVYGLTNRQMMFLFRNYSSKEKIQEILETRLDRVVFLLGLGPSPRVARQLVSHGHILVNGRKVTISSFGVRIGDVVSIRPESANHKVFEDLRIRLKQYAPPDWLKLNLEKLAGECVAMPVFGDTQRIFDVNMVGEFYSR